MLLTGRYTFRRTLTGRIVLRVEEDVTGHWFLLRSGRTRRRWRDAKLCDFRNTDLRLAYIELRAQDIVAQLP